MRPAILVVCALGLSLTSCVRAAPTPELTNQALITRSDIERIHAMTALDIVQRYRSDVLISRAPSSVLLNKHLHPVVFLNGRFFGAVAALRNLRAAGLEG